LPVSPGLGEIADSPQPAGSTLKRLRSRWMTFLCTVATGTTYLSESALPGYW
jgi:hypothetical protein